MYIIQYVYYMYVIWHIYILLIPKRLVRLKNSGLSSWFFEKKNLSSLKPCKCNKTICTVMVQFQKLHTQKKIYSNLFQRFCIFFERKLQFTFAGSSPTNSFSCFCFFLQKGFSKFYGFTDFVRWASTSLSFTFVFLYFE